MSMNFLTKKNGFTLIELLLYVAIVGVILTLISSFLTTMIISRTKTNTINEVNLQGLQAIEVIIQKIESADKVTIPEKGSSSNVLSIDNEIIFTLQNGTIYIEETLEPTNITNKKVVVSDLIFENLAMENSPDSIRISFTISRINHSGRSEYSYEKTFIGSASLRK